MSQTIGQAIMRGTRESLGAKAKRGAGRVIARLSAARAAHLTTAALAEMSPAQRADIGAAAPSRPTIAVEAGLMTRLMALR